MSDVYSTIFSDDPRTGALTAAQLDARRRIAAALATRNRPYPKTIGEGLTALGEGLGEGFANARLAKDEAERLRRNEEDTRRLQGGSDLFLNPAAPAPAAPAPAPRAVPGKTTMGEVPEDVVALATENTAPLTPAQATQQPQMPVEEWLQRVARNETGGRKDAYSLVGERSRRGDYPYGKYQVMGENIPVWTKKYLGQQMTPDEFLANPDAQEQVARARGSEYIAKYGPVGAAAAWFAGPNGMNDETRKDTLGTHVAEYKRRFNLPLVSRDQVAAAVPADAENAAPYRVASLGDGVTVPDTAAQPEPRQMVAQAVAGPQPQVQAQAAPPPAPPSQAPLVPPQAIPPPPAQEAQPTPPGPEPQLRDIIRANPEAAKRMQTAREIALNPLTDPAVAAQAQGIYNELRKQAEDAHTKQWTIWHERTKKLEDFRLNEDERRLQQTKLRGEAEDAAEKRILTQRFGGQEPAAWFSNFDKERTAAEMAARIRDDNRIMLQAYKDGAITGFGANARVNLAKIAAFAFNNGYASEAAAQNEIIRALGGSRIREALSQINPVGVASNTDLALSKMMSGTEPMMEPKAFLALLHKSSEYNAKTVNDFEDKRDYYLRGTRAERNYQIQTPLTSPRSELDKMLANRDDKAARAAYDDRYGEGSSALEIERFKRRQRRGE